VLGIIAAVLIGKFGGRVLRFCGSVLEKAKSRKKGVTAAHSL
jgi:hypothetical protein